MLKIEGISYINVDWNSMPEEIHKGETGIAKWRTFESGNIRARVVEYSPGYRADHWCSRGHVLFVLEGSLVSELKDGSSRVLSAGEGYVASDDEANPHRSHTETGAKLFIVD